MLIYATYYNLIIDNITTYLLFYYTTKNRLFTTIYENYPQIGSIFTVEINKIIPQKIINFSY